MAAGFRYSLLSLMAIPFLGKTTGSVSQNVKSTMYLHNAQLGKVLPSF